MKYLIVLLLIMVFNTGYCQTISTDSIITAPILNLENGISKCVLKKGRKTYRAHVGETFNAYILAEGWFTNTPSNKCINTMHKQIPFMDISLLGENHYIKYKKGRTVNGRINDTYIDKRYNKTDTYTIKGTLKNGLLNGPLTTYLNGEIILEGITKNGTTVGIWRHYHNSNLLFSYRFQENNYCPINVTKYYSESSKIEKTTSYVNGYPNNEMEFYPNGDTLSKLNCIDSTKIQYSYVKFHPNGAIMESGIKQLKNTISKQWNTGISFHYKKIGSWKYFNTLNILLRKETN